MFCIESYSTAANISTMPDSRVVYGCGNQASLENGISLHRISFFDDDRNEATLSDSSSMFA